MPIIPSLWCLVSAIHAQSASTPPEPAKLEPVKTEIQVSDSVQADTAAHLTLIESNTLARMPGVNLDDKLRLVPGFTLLRRSSSLAANPTTQGISLRGIGSSGASRTLVLSDGIPLNDPFGGWVYWTRSAPELVDRVEVSRGATTSVFGDRALGGAIHFLSAAPSQERMTLSAEGGNRGTFTPFASYSNLWKQRFSATVAMRALTTSGFFIVPETIRGEIDTRANVRFVAPQVKLDFLGARDRLSVKGDILAEERDNGTQLQQNSTSLGSVSGNYARTFASSTLSMLAYHQRQQFHASFSALAADRATEGLTSRQSVPASATGGAFLYAARGRINWVSGADFARTEGTSFDYLVPSGQRVGGGEVVQRGGFLQGDVAWKSWKFFGGSRYQWTGLTNGSGFYSPSGGFAWGRGWLRARGSAYRSFRAPTLNELYREFRAGNTTTLANEALRPEALFGAEVGVDATGERWRAGITFYRNELSDLIGNVTLSVAPNLITRQRQNIASAIARGAEIDVRYQWNRWLAEASYLLADSRFSTLERIPQVARHQGSAQLTWRRDRTQITGGLRSTSLQFEDDRNTQLLPGYAIFHAALLQELPRGLSLVLNLENAFDREYLAGFTPQPQIAAPRLVRFGIRWSGKFR
jgi:outer membrane cobalamin receptor